MQSMLDKFQHKTLLVKLDKTVGTLVFGGAADPKLKCFSITDKSAWEVSSVSVGWKSKEMIDTSSHTIMFDTGNNVFVAPLEIVDKLLFALRLSLSVHKSQMPGLDNYAVPDGLVLPPVVIKLTQTESIELDVNDLIPVYQKKPIY